jgi:hypothetical protein
MSKERTPLTSDEMVERMAQIVKNGLKLELMTENERSSYVAGLIGHISESSLFNAFYDNETRTVMVETSYFDPLLIIDITEDSVYFLPLSETNYYKAFMKVLEFIWLDQKRKKQALLNTEEEKPKKEIPNFDYL